MSRLPPVCRYLLTAGICFLVSNLIMIAGDRLGVPMPLDVAVAFIGVGALGFLLHCRLTFLAAPSWIGFARYLAATGANLPLSILWLFLFATSLGLPMAAAAPLSSICMVLVNFLASRWAILGRRRPALDIPRPSP